jgi:hypothetical protein
MYSWHRKNVQLFNKGKPVKVPDTDQVENLAKYINHFNLTEELETLGQNIKKFDQEVGVSMNNWVLALLYIAAIATGLYASSLVANPAIVLPAIGLVAGLSIDALKKMSNDVLHQLIKRLKDPECRRSIEELGNSLINFKKKHFPNFTFKIVGHSLGGIIAELCSVKIGVECITFESSGAKEILDQLAEYKDSPRNIINFLSAPNIINTLNNHPGTTYRLKLPHTDGSFSFAHGANCVVQSSFRVFTYCTLGVFTVGKITIAETAGMVVGAKFAGGVTGLWQNIEWLKGQHSIDNIVIYLNSNDPRLIKMKSWPWVYWQSFNYMVKEFARDFLPLQKDKAGVRNMFDEKGMREAQIKRIPGYQEDENI